MNLIYIRVYAISNFKTYKYHININVIYLDVNAYQMAVNVICADAKACHAMRCMVHKLVIYVH
jgi:hypothetical protein